VICNASLGTSITLYDAVTSVNPIAILDPGSSGGRLAEYDLDFYNGLYVVSVGGTCDFTIVYE
jgi:hypothetical protein